METAIIYKTKYGSTRTYAQWLADDLQAALFEAETISARQLEAYDQVIFGGSIFASGVRGIQWLKKNYPQLHDKRIAVFAVGASPSCESTIAAIRGRSLEAELAQLPFFYLRGRFDEQHMTWPDRKLCGFLKKQLEKKPDEELVGWERSLVEAYSQSGGKPVTLDWVSKGQLAPLLAWAREPVPVT